ncbi:MAG: pseudouridine synthase [Helicobacteraceae bacterium]|jgi:23S rRNA pseudouridine2605 synthase|nr:pseudouridine synthase [Helicobacteraceae bacterium]
MNDKQSNLTRINKAVAERGGYSRREAERLILEGRVAIGRQKVSDLSIKVKEGDELFLDGRALAKRDGQYTVIVYHKPKGELVTRSDPQGRKTVFDGLPSRFSRFIAVGRLDYASEGLLMLTDAAEVADKLMRSDLERVYNVKIDGFVTPAIEKAMSEGLKLSSKAGAHPLNDEMIGALSPFAKWRLEKNHPRFSRLKIALSEGKNREIRRFFAHFGRNTLDLKRVSFGEISLNALPVGKWRFCSKEEYRFLRRVLNGDREEN